MTVFFQCLLVLACLTGYAFFAGMETGVISIHRLRLRHLVRQNLPGARILCDFVQHPDRLLGTTLVGTNLCMVIASVTSASLAAELLGPAGPPICGVIITLVALTCCEYLPKAWFRSDPAYRTLPAAKWLRAAGVVLYPIGHVIVAVTKLFVPVSRRATSDAEPFITHEELKHLTKESEQGGFISADERRMIHGVFELRHRPCSGIMVPREQMITVGPRTAAADVLHLARAKDVSRLPVYREETGRFVGIVNALDVVTDTHAEGKSAMDYARPPQFASADTPVDDLLLRMRTSRQPMALVTDERSDEVLGLVTSEDILEEIVGEL